MKLRHAVLSLAIAALLPACGEKVEPQAVTAAEPDAASVEPIPAPAQVPVSGAKVISGIALEFPNTVRSDKVEDVDAGVKRHNLRIEYQTVDENAVAKSLTETFSKNGFKVSGSDGRKFVAYTKDGRKIRYAISAAGPDMNVKLSPDSKGLVTFIWEESVPAISQ